jgi:hypothetical protein
MATICLLDKKKWKMWTQKICQNSVKSFLKIKHHQMKNLLLKCIENFLIYTSF